MTKKYCMAQSLRAGILDGGDQIISALKDLGAHFQKVFNGNRRGTLVNDIFDSAEQGLVPDSRAKQKILNGETIIALKSWFQGHSWRPKHVSAQATVWTALMSHGAAYKPASVSPRDSYVVVGLGVPHDWKAAQIISIFQQEYRDGLGSLHSFVLCEVKYYRELSEDDLRFDYYRKYPHAGGRIYYQDQEPEPKIIPATRIICHFARTEDVSSAIFRPHIHVLPLDRVSLFFFETEES